MATDRIVGAAGTTAGRVWAFAGRLVGVKKATARSYLQQTAGGRTSFAAARTPGAKAAMPIERSKIIFGRSGRA